MIVVLRNRNKDVKYSRLEGVKHNSWGYAYDKKLIMWLLEKEK